MTEEQKRERKKKRAENLELREFTNKVKTLVEKYKDQITPMVIYLLFTNIIFGRLLFHNPDLFLNSKANIAF